MSPKKWRKLLNLVVPSKDDITLFLTSSKMSQGVYIELRKFCLYVIHINTKNNLKKKINQLPQLLSWDRHMKHVMGFIFRDCQSNVTFEKRSIYTTMRKGQSGLLLQGVV